MGVVSEGIRPSTYGGARATVTREWSEKGGGRETEAVMGDEEATTPSATPVEKRPASQRIPPSTRYIHTFMHSGILFSKQSIL